MPKPRRNLVISPIGDESMHASWLVDRPRRTFDLMLIHYGTADNYGRSDADYYAARKGFKWELMDFALQEFRAEIERYDYIWCPDCDIRATTDQVNQVFDVMREHRLQLAQPAIAVGEITYKFLRPRRGVKLRFTPFVEVMCPAFSRQAFYRLQPTFCESRSGWGLDLLWARHFAKREMAIIDAVGVEHTGKLFRGENYQSLARLGISPGEELERIIKRHGGFNRRLHRRLVRDRVKLPALWIEPPKLSAADKLLERLGFDRKCA
jgi:hypothetical protein